MDLSARVKHGALLDAELLAEIYLELVGGREPGLGLAASDRTGTTVQTQKIDRLVRSPRTHDATADELVAHALFLEKIKDSIWNAE